MKHHIFLTAFLLTALLLTAHGSLLTTASAATPGFDTLVNYDTAWTYVYDGGKQTNGTSIYDDFYDLKSFPDGSCICVGESGDTTAHYGIFLVKLSSSGKIIWKKLLNGKTIGPYHGGSISITKNGDFLIGGLRYSVPWALRTDSTGNIKWSTWLYDSVASKPAILTHGCTINTIRETSQGTIICAAGDPYPNNGGSALNNYAAYLQFDSLGTLQHYREWSNISGYNIGGFDIEETQGGNYLLAGNEAVFYLDSVGRPQWQTKYTFQLTGVGSEVNNINRAKVLRDNTPLVMGQAYEGNCWTKYQKLYYDAWWSPIGYESGLNTNWDTAGFSGGDDYMYDFTQLNNGNLVFVGNKSWGNGATPVWVIVTDSLGKKSFFEKQFSISTAPGLNANMFPFSVASTIDGGFTVVGRGTFDTTTGSNAFAMHFIPKPMSAVMYRGNFQAKSINSINVHVSGTRLVVSGNAATKNIDEVSLFDITGKRLPFSPGTTLRSGRRTSGAAVVPERYRREGRGEVASIQFDISHLAHGTYVVLLKTETASQSIKFVY